MEEDVEPATDAELRGVLPRLQAIAMREVMQRFPIIKGLVTVLNWCICCSQSV